MLDLSEYYESLNDAVNTLRLEYEKIFDVLYDNFDIESLFECNDDVLDLSKIGEYLFIFFIVSLSDIFVKSYIKYKFPLRIAK